MDLYCKKITSGKPVLIILHGLYGMSDNWMAIAKNWAEYFDLYLVDLRNHGRSPHSDEFDYTLMSQDIVELMDKEEISKAVVLGHSMGGKVAMHMAMEHPNRLNALIVVDIAPKNYKYDTDGNVKRHLRILKGMRSLDLKSLKKREEINELLSESIPEERTRQFIMKNLKREKTGFAWKLNVELIFSKLPTILEGFDDDKIKTGLQGFPTLFIKGAESAYIQEADLDKIEEIFPLYELEVVENAGHWIHTEQPKELEQLVLDFLQS